MKKMGREGNQEFLDRYQKHLVKQTKDAIKGEDIGVLFTTSSILKKIPKFLDLDDLDLDGVMHGGAPMSREDYKVFSEEVYSGIPFAGLFGTAITGVDGFQVPDEEDFDVKYISGEPYRKLDVVDEEGEPAEEGHLTTSIYHEDILIPALRQDDIAKKTEIEGYEEISAVKNIHPNKTREDMDEGGVY